MYTDGCDQRFEFTRRMVAEFNQSHPHIKLTFVPKIITPSEGTIDTYGPHWRDGAIP